MERLTDRQLDGLERFMERARFAIASISTDYNCIPEAQVRCLIDEVRDWRRRAVTSERYDNELVIAEDEKRECKANPRRISRTELDRIKPEPATACKHTTHLDCGPGWVCYFE